MKDLMRRLQRVLRHIGARSIIIAVIVLLMTAGIAVYAGRRLSSTEKGSSAASGQAERQGGGHGI